MGGDHGVSVTVPAAISFLSRHDDAEMVLVGLPDAIRAQLKKLHALDHPRVSIVEATEVITMDDPVEVALRKKKDSSMRVAITPNSTAVPPRRTTASDCRNVSGTPAHSSATSTPSGTIARIASTAWPADGSMVSVAPIVSASARRGA